MAILILMRHANAELASPGMRDFDRPLSRAGLAEADTAMQMFKATGITPTRAFCSPARRTLETLECFCKSVIFDRSAIEFDHELYTGNVNVYANTLSKLNATDNCLLIGHNPMIEHFAFDLAQNSRTIDLEKLKPGFPTAGIAIFELNNTPNSTNTSALFKHFFNPNAA